MLGEALLVSKFSMLKQNRTKIFFILISCLIIFITLSLWFYAPFLEPKKLYIENHDKGFKIESNGEVFKTVGRESIEKVYTEFYDKNDYFMTDITPNNLILTRLSGTKGLREQVAFQFKLQREITGIKFLDYRKIVITDKSFDESYLIVKNNNFFDYKVKLDNVIVSESPKSQEIERQKNYDRATDPYIIKRGECEAILEIAQENNSQEYVECVEKAYRIKNEQ